MIMFQKLDSYDFLLFKHAFMSDIGYQSNTEELTNALLCIYLNVIWSLKNNNTQNGSAKDITWASNLFR